MRFVTVTEYLLMRIMTQMCGKMIIYSLSLKNHVRIDIKSPQRQQKTHPDQMLAFHIQEHVLWRWRKREEIQKDETLPKQRKNKKHFLK